MPAPHSGRATAATGGAYAAATARRRRGATRRGTAPGREASSGPRDAWRVRAIRGCGAAPRVDRDMRRRAAAGAVDTHPAVDDTGSGGLAPLSPYHGLA